MSTGVHLDHISGNFGSNLGIVLGSHRRTSDFLTRAILGLWADKSTDRDSDAILSPPVQFQVASCGGSSAEHPDLDHCGNTDRTTNELTDDPKKTSHDEGDDATIVPDNSSANESNNPSTPSQETQPNTVLDLSPLTSARTNDFGLQGDPNDLSTLTDQFAADEINPPAVPIDTTTPQIPSPAAPIVDPIAAIDDPWPPDLLPPDPVLSIGDPGPVLDPLPIFTSPASSPIPETSTEVMFMIGFGIVALTSRRKALNPMKHGLVEAFYKITKRPFHHYTT